MISGVGPALVDRICRIDRYPERGGQAIVRESIRQPGGAAANTIFGLSKFGEKCRFYTTLGRDADADLFRTSLESAGAEVKAWVTHPETGRVDIYVDSDGERTFFVHPNAAGTVRLELEDSDYEETKLFYLDPFPSDESFNAHVQIAKRAKNSVVLNPGYPYSSLGFERLRLLLKHVDIIILSEFEFKMLGVSEKEILKYVSVLVVTLGERGSKAYTEGKEVYCPAFKVKAVDTTGAGDAFAAGFLKAMLEGRGLEECLKAGNYVAAYNVQHYGARNFPEWSDVTKVLEKC